MRLLYNTNGLAHHRLADAIDLVADLGYDGLALTPDVGHLDPFHVTPAAVDAVAAHLRRRHLSVTLQTGARYVLDRARKHHPTLLDPDPAARARRTDLLVRCLDLARDLGAPVLSFWSGVPLGPGPAPLESRDALVERLADGCAEIAAAAALRGVRAALEPEPGMLVGTVAEFDALSARVAARHGPAAVPFLALDVGHVHCNREGDLREIVRTHAAVLADVQIEDMREGEHLHLPFGEGTLPPGPVVAALRDVGYDGPLVVELSRDSHRAPEVAAAALRVLRPLLR